MAHVHQASPPGLDKLKHGWQGAIAAVNNMRQGGKECPNVQEGGIPELITALRQYRPERLIIVCHFGPGEHGKGHASLFSPSSGLGSHVDEDTLVDAIVQNGTNLKVVIFDMCDSETVAARLHEQWRARVCHIQAWSTKSHDGGAAILLQIQTFYMGQNDSAAESLRRAKTELSSWRGGGEDGRRGGGVDSPGLSGIEVRTFSDGSKSEFPKFVIDVDPNNGDMVYQAGEDLTARFSMSGVATFLKQRQAFYLAPQNRTAVELLQKGKVAPRIRLTERSTTFIAFCDLLKQEKGEPVDDSGGSGDAAAKAVAAEEAVTDLCSSYWGRVRQGEYENRRAVGIIIVYYCKVRPTSIWFLT
jgi:hypothetical protein